VPRERHSGVKKLSPDRYVINRGTLNNNLQNMSRLFTEIRAVPNFQNGATAGFKLSQIEAGSIFQDIGLQDGDVLTAVEGQQINDPLKAMTLLQTVRERPSITVNVTRNGSPMQLHYNIR
jgi:general secretion pathway protein C